MTEQASDGWVIEQGGIVIGLHLQLASVVPDVEQQVKLGGNSFYLDRRLSCRLRIRNLARLTFRRAVAGVQRVSQLKCHLEQRVATHVALGVQFRHKHLEGEVLMSICSQRHFPDASEQGAEARVTGEIHS